MKLVEKYPMIMIVIGVMGVSCSSIFVKYSEAPSAVTAAFRLLWTVLLMSPVVFGKKTVRQEFVQADRKSIILSVVSGLFLAAHFALWFESLQHTSVASSTTIVATEVIWVSLGFCLFLKGRLSGKAAAAIVLALVGSAMIALSDSGSQAHLYGDILSLLAAIAVSVYMLIGRVVREKLSTTVYTYMVYSACAVSLVALCLVQGNGLFSFGFSPVIVGLLLAVFSTIMGHSVFNWCLKYFTPSFISTAKLCEPVVAAILAGFLFGELPKPLQLLGGAMILAGVYYYSRLERKNSNA